MDQTTGLGDLIIYTAADGTARTEVHLQNDTLWLSEKQISGLFGRDRTVVGRHIKNIFQTGELEEESNVQKLHVESPPHFFSIFWNTTGCCTELTGSPSWATTGSPP